MLTLVPHQQARPAQLGRRVAQSDSQRPGRRAAEFAHSERRYAPLRTIASISRRRSIRRLHGRPSATPRACGASHNRASRRRRSTVSATEAPPSQTPHPVHSPTVAAEDWSGRASRHLAAGGGVVRRSERWQVRRLRGRTRGRPWSAAESGRSARSVGPSAAGAASLFSSRGVERLLGLRRGPQQGLRETERRRQSRPGRCGHSYWVMRRE